MPFSRRTLLLGVSTCLAGSHLTLQAQTAATPPLRLVVAYPAGDQSDQLTRAVAKQLSLTLNKRPVMVVNRPGHGAQTAMAYVAQAPADGNTLLVLQGFVLPATAAIANNLSFDPEHDFVPVSELASNAGLLVAHRSLPVHTVRDLLLHARNHLGSVRMGSWARGSTPHIVQSFMSHQMGAPVAYVDYPGEAPILKDLLRGKINLALLSPTLLKPHAASSELHILSVMGTQRNAIFPDIPTMHEMGFVQPLFQTEPPTTVFAPKGTPTATITALGDAFFTAVHSPTIKSLMDESGIRLIGSRSAQAQKRFADYYPVIKALTSLSGARLD